MINKRDQPKKPVGWTGEYTLRWKGVGIRAQAAACLKISFYGYVKKLNIFVKILKMWK